MSEAVALEPRRAIGRGVKCAPVDVHVGNVIRARRRILGLTQQELADAIGLSFQQVQKYENGQNRVSCSVLVQIAGALQASPSEFFPDPAAAVGADAMELIYDVAASAHGLPMLRFFQQLSPRGQEAALKLMVEIFRTEALVSVGEAHARRHDA